MRIGQVIGTVSLKERHSTLEGGSYRVVVPLSLSDLLGETTPSAEPIIVYDDRGSGVGDRIAISEGGEATQPFAPADKPIDAYNAAILDRVLVRRP